MAAIVVSQTISRWTGRTKDRAGYLRALEPGDDLARKDLETMVLGLPHFEVFGLTDTNTADSDALNLSDQGVTFPDGTCRLVTVKAFVADNDGQGVVEAKFIVDGGSTPIVGSDLVDSDAVKTTGLGTAPTLDVEVATNEVIIEAVGVTDVDIRWVIHVWVSDLITLPYIATT